MENYTPGVDDDPSSFTSDGRNVAAPVPQPPITDERLQGRGIKPSSVGDDPSSFTSSNAVTGHVHHQPPVTDEHLPTSGPPPPQSDSRPKDTVEPRKVMKKGLWLCMLVTLAAVLGCLTLVALMYAASNEFDITLQNIIRPRLTRPRRLWRSCR